MYSGSTTNEAPKKEWKLEKEQELRLEIEAGSKGKGYVTVKLLTGVCCKDVILIELLAVGSDDCS